MPQTTFTQSYRRLLDMLIELRRRSGKTQSELAKQLGKQQSFVSNMERGIRRLDVIEYCVVAKILGGNPLKMIGEVVDNLPKTLSGS